MVLNWLQSLFLGLVTGFAELLPISSDAHLLLLVQMFGSLENVGVYRLFCHLGILAALIVVCRPQLNKFRRQRMLTNGRHSVRQLDMSTLLDRKILKVAAVPMALCYVAWQFLDFDSSSLLFVSLMLVINGAILYIPQFLPQGNKESLSISGLDSVLTGFAGGLSVIPGISRLGTMASMLRIRGALGEYAVNLSLLLCIPALIITLFLDIFALFASPVAFSFAMFGTGLLSAIASLSGAYFGALLMRFLSVRIGFSGFAYYNWGAALFAFIIFLWI